MTTNEEVLKEFRKKFCIFNPMPFAPDRPELRVNISSEAVESFLSQALTTREEEIRKECQEDHLAIEVALIEQARKEERNKIESNIGSLRQWLNEKPKDFLVTNEHIKKWLFDGLSKQESGV